VGCGNYKHVAPTELPADPLKLYVKEQRVDTLAHRARILSGEVKNRWFVTTYKSLMEKRKKVRGDRMDGMDEVDGA
jgi:hypothetical protein